MKKLVAVFALIVLLSPFLVAFQVNYTKLHSYEPLVLDESTGSRTKSVDFSVLSSIDSNTIVVIVSGWLFDPGSEERECEVSIQLKGNGEYYEKLVSLSRQGLYFVMKPFLLSFERGYSLSVMESVIDYESVLEDAMKKLEYECLAVEIERSIEAGILVGVVEEKGFRETSVISGEPVLVIQAGEKPTGGYEIEVTSVLLIETRIIEVYATLRSPSSGEFVTQAFTYPRKAFKIIGVVPGTYDLIITLEVMRDERVIDTEIFSSSLSVE
ncbi:MAG: protease complex subunit PrcB family protein [Kosmotogaceae bacterium]|nr:protease complex subunit PrcB family protein [Kosmotogaceae bacterium]